ncbi:hypothetical protein [Marinobacter sp. SS21]|uniref:hypothetical protein n=1 Tax=Marinobacter sp. SS21 TaxID=2979460 RepID=UPI0023309A71|nr:hypothetical protein [Marinobacter sp. SS21]MDC0662426.1 hypothetical protein [Marinobacter sp. SS21]
MTTALTSANVINLDSLALPAFELERKGWGIPDREDWVIDRKFRQTDARRRFSILFKRFNRHYLAIRTESARRAAREQFIDLTFVEPTPREVRQFHPGIWILALVLVVLPFCLLALLPLRSVWAWLPVALGMTMMAHAWRMRRHYFEFQALNTDIPVFAVDARLPDKARVEVFLHELSDSIAVAQRSLPPGRERIPLAVAEMRRLSEAGVITPEAYDAAKQRWFGR